MSRIPVPSSGYRPESPSSMGSPATDTRKKTSKRDEVSLGQSPPPNRSHMPPHSSRAVSRDRGATILPLRDIRTRRRCTEATPLFGSAVLVFTRTKQTRCWYRGLARTVQSKDPVRGFFSSHRRVCFLSSFHFTIIAFSSPFNRLSILQSPCLTRSTLGPPILSIAFLPHPTGNPAHHLFSHIPLLLCPTLRQPPPFHPYHSLPHLHRPILPPYSKHMPRCQHLRNRSDRHHPIT